MAIKNTVDTPNQNLRVDTSHDFTPHFRHRVRFAGSVPGTTWKPLPINPDGSVDLTPALAESVALHNAHPSREFRLEIAPWAPASEKPQGLGEAYPDVAAAQAAHLDDDTSDDDEGSSGSGGGFLN